MQVSYWNAMSLYFVRWPDLRVSLISASDEHDLVRQLDEVADPSSCRWAEYDGSVWVDFSVPATVISNRPADRPPTSLDDLEIDGANGIASRADRGDALLDASLGPREAGSSSELQENLLHWAFPDLAYALLDREDDQPTDPRTVGKALKTEVQSLLEYQRDPEAFCQCIEEERGASRAPFAPMEYLIVGEFTAGGVEYQALLRDETEDGITICRVVKRAPHEGGGGHIEVTAIGTARWNPGEKTVTPTDETPAECVPLLDPAQVSLRAELAEQPN